MEIRVTAGEVVSGDAEEVEGLIMISTAAVVIMAIDHRGRGGRYDDGGGGQGGVVGGITTDMMVTVADMADPQVEGMEMDPSVQGYGVPAPAPPGGAAVCLLSTSY
jgi:hypothetical protein